MSHLHLENIKPVRDFWQQLRMLYPAPWHHHEVRVKGRDGREYRIFIPEGRPDTLVVVGAGKSMWFHHLDEAREYLKEVVGLEKLPSL